MKNAFFYFEKYKEIPPVLVNDKGDYVTEEVVMPEEPKPEMKVKKKVVHSPQPIKDEDLAKSVDKLPVYPGGNDSFQDFINSVEQEYGETIGAWPK